MLKAHSTIADIEKGNLLQRTSQSPLALSDRQINPSLTCKMTSTQYLNAFSQPRNEHALSGEEIPQIGQKSPILRSAGFSEPGDSSDPGSTTDLSNESNSFEALNAPGSASKRQVLPTGQQERDVERVCRLICLTPVNLQQQVESQLRQVSKARSRFAFMDTRNGLFSYYQWRLRKNKAGYGIPPDFDNER